MLSVVDETEDDWQAITALGTHASPLGGAMGGKGRKTTTRLGAFRDTINAAFHLDRQ